MVRRALVLHVFVFAFVLPLWFAQPAAQGRQNGPPSTPPASNLRVLTPDVNLLKVMTTFNAALGVQCTYCHVAADRDFANDGNPKKEIARNMLRMLKQVAMRFSDSGNDFLNSRYLPFPEGKQYVTCYTCHRGSVQVVSAVPDPHGPERAPEPGSPPPAGGRGGRGAPAAAGNQPAGRAAPPPDLPPGRGVQQHMNMVYLPQNTDTFLVMPAFRAAIGVECNFCHVFGERLERGHADERHLDDNPKKRIARSMIGMLKDINTALFPHENIDIVFAASSIVPDGKRYVTCYSCHRGTHLPLSEPPPVTKAN